MKHIILAYALLLSSIAQATPPTAVNGEKDTTPTYVQNVKVPNYQATKKAGLDMRIETGNTNLLQNPSFEHSTVNTGWGSPSLGTVTAESTIVVDGVKSIRLNSAGGGTRMVQVSTINAAYLKGQQMVARVKIDTNDTALYVCAVVDNITTGDTNCMLVPVTTTDMPFKQIEIPFIGGGTSNGIVIKSATTGSTNTYIDDAFVGTMTPFQGVNGAKLVGTIKITGCSQAWTIASTSYVDFSPTGITGCVYTATGQAQSPSTSIPGIKFASLPAGDYRLEYEGQVYSPVTSKNAFFRFYDGTNFATEEASMYSTTAATGYAGISQSISYSTTQSNVTLRVSGKNDASGGAYIYGTTQNPGVIKVWYFPPESRNYSQASLDYDWTDAGITSSTTGWQAFNGGGTITSINIQKKRKGGDLFLRGSFIAPSGMTNTAFRIPLPDSLTIKSGAVVDAPFGSLTASTAWGTQLYYLGSHAGGNGYMDIYNWGSGSGYSLNTSNTTMPSAGTFYFNAGPIPIQQWSDYGVIVGSFAGIEKCASDLECADTLSASYLSTGVVDKQTLPGIFGNCTASSGDYTNCSFAGAGFTQVPTCVASLSGVAAGNNAIIRMEAITTTTFQIYTRNSTFASTAYPFTVSCTKSGVDYKPKTAKVATSNYVNTTPGILAPKLYSARISSTGAVSGEVGDLFNGNCVAGAGTIQVCTFTSGIWTSAPNCSCTAPTGAGYTTCTFNAEPTTSTVELQTGYATTASAMNREILCHGY